MGSHRNSYCVLSNYDVAEYKATGIRPRCIHHEHLSENKVKELTRSLLFTRRDFNGKEERVYEYLRIFKSTLDFNPKPFQAIVDSDPREWKIKRSGGFAGMETHQLVRQGR